MGALHWTHFVWRRLLATSGWFFTGIWNALAMVVLLAVAATLPVVQLAVLGYLMEVSGRLARRRRWSDLFLGWKTAGRWGRWLAGLVACLAPLWLIQDWYYSAYLINTPASEPPALAPWTVVLAAALLVHLLAAAYAGGDWRHWLWPYWFPLVVWQLVRRNRPARDWFPPAMAWQALREGRLVREAREALWNNLAGLHLGYLFWLGLRGMVATLLWLIVPVSLMAIAFQGKGAGAGLLAAAGAILYGIIAFYLPYLQTAFAAEGKLQAFRHVAAVRTAYRSAPMVMSVAWIVFFALSLPLYLLKIEYTPRELAWLPAVVFVCLGLPGRWAVGWAWGYAQGRPQPAPRWARWLGNVLLWPAAAAYVFIVFLSQYASWHGTWALLEQPALLLPVPFWLQ
ncbi:MAG: hypothetical protein KatS3mg110_4010 [Pirellulaceae bacterium]|nr:MAG: hypothetical protein KatS3mg110_4005 [Pirellulaceae bacterium]GIW95969.1 MAG: hypothetical protein KatS3mg110_4010 [Pirellulaceae bacterium]